MTRRVDPDIQFPDLNKRRFNWRKWLTIAAVGIPLATAGFYLYRNIRAEPTPDESDILRLRQAEPPTTQNLAVLLGCVPGLAKPLAFGCHVGLPHPGVDGINVVLDRFTVRSRR